MKNAVALFLAMSCAGFAQIDTSILKAGNTWEYEHGRESRLTGSLQSSFKGTAFFRIDTVRKSGPDSVFYSVSRLDSGVSTDYPGSGTGKTFSRAVYLLTRGNWHPVTPDHSEYVPRFAFAGLFAKPFRWAVLEGDTLRFNQNASTPFHTCAPATHRYLESVGLISYTYNASCGITSTAMQYHLISRNGKPFMGYDSIVLPLTMDFAPYALGRYWEYHVVERRTESQPISGFHATTVDSLRWSFQVVGLGRDGDSMIVLEANVQGRKSMGSPLSPRGDTVDVSYLDTALFRGGSAYPSWDPRGEGGTRFVFDLHAAFQPFYDAHGAVLGHLPEGSLVRDTLLDGQTAKMIVIVRRESQGRDSIAFIQGVGMVRKYYAGFFQALPSTGSQSWSGNIVLSGTGNRPVGMGPGKKRAFNRGRPAAGAWMRGGSVWLEGRRFDADGRRSAPIR